MQSGSVKSHVVDSALLKYPSLKNLSHIMEVMTALPPLANTLTLVFMVKSLQFGLCDSFASLLLSNTVCQWMCVVTNIGVHSARAFSSKGRDSRPTAALSEMRCTTNYFIQRGNMRGKGGD